MAQKLIRHDRYRMYEQPILKSREPRCSDDAKELGEARNEAVRRPVCNRHIAEVVLLQLARITRIFVLRSTSDVIAGYLPPKSMSISPVLLPKADGSHGQPNILCSLRPHLYRSKSTTMSLDPPSSRKSSLAGLRHSALSHF